MEVPQGTKPIYQHEGQLRELSTQVLSVQPFNALPAAEQALFKQHLSAAASAYIVVTSSTIFYPQGGGQPSDVGFMESLVPGGASFQVLSVRNGPQKRTLHLGTFSPSPSSTTFATGEMVKQVIDGQKRDLYSRLHTAGHIIGVAVHELSAQIPDVVDTKAQHYPEAAYVEFRGTIDGKHLEAIQAKTDELVDRKLKIKLHWWDEPELREKCKAVLEGFVIPEGEKARAVEIEGVGAYPCGGTHVLDSGGVGKIVVSKIKRSKGISRISYSVVPLE